MVQLGKYLFFLLVALNLSSCDKDQIKEKDFILWGNSQNEGRLKTNGVYVNLTPDSLVTQIFILYKDGIIYGPTVICSETTLNEIQKDFCTIERNRDVPWCWGAYTIDASRFWVQSPQIRAGGQFTDLGIWQMDGKVKNDTTFSLNRENLGKGWEEIDEKTFVFVQVNDKPDSMNVLIEELGAP